LSIIDVNIRFKLSGFRFQSKYEARTSLLTKYELFVDGGHPGFEMHAIGKSLKYNEDAQLFMQRIEKAARTIRYRVLLFAKRKFDGSLPIAGFCWLHCSTSMKMYGRTIARYLFFVMQSHEHSAGLAQACQALGRIVQANESPSSQCRFLAVEEVLFQSLIQPPGVSGFLIDTFAQLYYVVAPNGCMNRTADFVRHVAVHLIYAVRGAYIVKCQSRWDADDDEHLSARYLNGQKESAFSSLQSTKAIAAACLESVEGKLQWSDNGHVDVETVTGIVSVSCFAIAAMYRNLLGRCKALMTNLGFPVLGFDLIEKCVDVFCIKPGEGIMSMNTHIYDAYYAQFPDLARILSEAQRNNSSVSQFCRNTFELSVTLVKALYLSGGPSARLTEICCWTIANTESNCVRNLRYVRKAIAVVNTYSKSQDSRLTDVQTNIACFADQVFLNPFSLIQLPLFSFDSQQSNSVQELSSLVLTFLIVIKRFELLVLCNNTRVTIVFNNNDTKNIIIIIITITICDIQVFGEQASINSRLCFTINKGVPLKGETLGKLFRGEFLNQGLQVTISDMRHVLEAYARKEGCCLESAVSSNVLLRMANHNEGSSNAVYGKGKGHDLPDIPADRMEECYRYSEHWNKRVLGSSFATHAVCSVCYLIIA
jgi:hypothetical protein